MKRWKLVALLVSLVSMASVSAIAGQKHAFPVVAGSNYFSGALGSARNSADGLQLISVDTIDGDTYSYAYFMATTADGQYKGCLTGNPSMVAAARSVSSDSSIEVSWGQDGYCSFVHVVHSSDSEPKR